MPVDNMGGDALHTVFITIAAGLGTAITAYVKKKFTDVIQSIRRIEESLPSLLKIVDELQPNGGNSLRDKIDCIAKRVVHQEVSRRMLVDLALETPFLECNKEGACIYASREWSKLTGISNTDAKGEGWLAAISKNDRERISEEWTNAVSHEIECNSNALIISGKPIEFKSRVLRIDSGQVVGFIIYLKPNNKEI